VNDFWKQHFDKILLSALFLIALGTFMHFARGIEFYGNAQNVAHLTGVVNWLENTVGQILAALLTLMVGRSLTGTPRPNGNNSVSPAPIAPAPPVLQTSAEGAPNTIPVPAAAPAPPAGWPGK